MYMQKTNLAPVCIFTYNRLDVLQETIESLKKNMGAEETSVYIYSDGARGEKDINDVNDVRKYINTIREGFKSVSIIESPNNKGLAKSVIDGVTEVINRHKKIIVLEDDLVLSSNFLVYMNAALDTYEKEERVFSVTGYSKPIKGIKDDVYFTKRSSSLGWGSWLDRWEKIDWEVKDFNEFISSRSLQKAFNQMGSDMTHMLRKQMDGKINSWAIRWCYHQYKYDLFSVHPTTSKVLHIGNDDRASNASASADRFYTILDTGEKLNFNFDKDIKLKNHYLKQFLRNYSITTRVKYRLINLIVKLIK